MTDFTTGPIDIYSRLDGSLAGLLAQHLKSCESVDYRPTAARERRLPASETQQGERLATAGSNAAGLQRDAPGERRRRRRAVTCARHAEAQPGCSGSTPVRSTARTVATPASTSGGEQ
jgi:hypothetical protein